MQLRRAVGNRKNVMNTRRGHTLLLMIASGVVACGGADGDSDSQHETQDSESSVIPTVFAAETFSVNVTYDVVYGRGIQRVGWDAPQGTAVPLFKGTNEIFISSNLRNSSHRADGLSSP